MAHSVRDFAELIHKIVKSDRGVNLAVSGETGEGKSTFLIQLQQEYSKIANMHWDFDHVTWERKELLRWIDGEGDDKEGQKPEYSALLADELITMFFSQDWYETEQKDAVKILNMCRDRHLFIGGNTPNFFDLTSKIRDRFRFYVFVPERGTAWVLVPEKNPFTKDRWNTRENMKIVRRYGVTKSPNYAFTVNFGPLSEEDEKKYLSIRNKKRIQAVKDENGDNAVVMRDRKDRWLGFILKSFSKYSKLTPIQLYKHGLINMDGTIAKKYIAMHEREEQETKEMEEKKAAIAAEKGES